MTWALFELAKNSHVQKRLREELLSVATPNPSVEELNALTYLDFVVRETIRLNSPATLTVRLATEDDVLPLQTPVVDELGKLHHEIR
jgi:cytochrome P450